MNISLKKPTLAKSLSLLFVVIYISARSITIAQTPVPPSNLDKLYIDIEAVQDQAPASYLYTGLYDINFPETPWVTKSDTNGRASFLFNPTRINQPTVNEEKQLYPNPTNDNVYAYFDEPGIARLIDLSGKVVMEHNPAEEGDAQVDVTPGIYLYQYMEEDGDIDIQKLSVLSNYLSLHFVNEMNSSNESHFKAAGQPTHLARLTDSTQNYDSKDILFNVDDLTIADKVGTLHTRVDYSIKNDTIKGLMLGATNATVSDDNGFSQEENLTNGAVDIPLSERYNQNTGRDINITFSGGEHSNATSTNATFFGNELMQIADTLFFDYQLNGPTNIGNALEFEGMGIDTTFVADNDSYQINFKAKAPTGMDINLKSTSGDLEKELQQYLVPKFNTADLTLEQTGNPFFLYGQIKTSGTNIPIEGARAIAWSDGNTLLSGISNATGNYQSNVIMSELSSMVVDSITFSKENHQGFSLPNHPLNAGGELLDAFLIQAVQTNNFWLYGNGTDGEGSPLPNVNAQAYANGLVVFNANTVANGNYETNHIALDQEIVSLDSVVFKLAGYNTFNTGAVSVSKDGHPINFSLSSTANPLEEFNIVAGTTSRYASLQFKEGEIHIQTITANANGQISATSIDWQLDGGKNISVIYSAPNTDNDTIVKLNVQDGNYLNIDNILNTYFNFDVTADNEGSWDINGETGSGNGNAQIKTRANSLAYTLSASAPDAQAVNRTGVANPGTTSEVIAFNWQYTVRNNNTTTDAGIVGSVDGSQKYEVVGTGSMVEGNFTSTDKSVLLNVVQTKGGYEPTNQNFSISKGTSNVNLDNMVEITNAIWAYGISSTPVGANVAVWKDGGIVMNGVVSGSGYTSSSINVPLPFTADSLVATAINHTKYLTTTELTWTSEGGLRKEFNLTEIVNPLETFYTDAGVITRNGQIVVREGATVIGTLTADGSGNVAANSFDHQLDDGKDITLTYSAPNADGETTTEYDVDDEEHINISHLLNAYFPVSVSADDEANWSATSSAGTNNGTGNGSFTHEARANSLAITFSASASNAEAYSSTTTFNPGGGTKNITMNWEYTINMSNTESGSAITGTFNGTQVYTTTGNGGTVNDEFTRSGVKSGTLVVGQTRSGFNATSNSSTVNKGSNSITLDDMVQTTQNIRFRGYSSSPEGTVVTVTEEGTSVSGTVTSGAYTTGYMSVTLPVTIDQIVADGPSGWIDETVSNISVSSAGDQVREFNLEEEASGEQITINGRVSTLTDSYATSLNDAIMFRTSQGTYDADTDGSGNFSVTIDVIAGGETVHISSGASGYNSDFLAVVGRSSSSDNGEIGLSSGSLDGTDLRYIITPTWVTDNSDFQSSIAAGGNYQKGASVERYIILNEQSTGTRITAAQESAVRSALDGLPNLTSTSTLGQMINYTGGVQTTETGLPAGNKVQVLTWYGEGYWNLPTSTGATVIAEGATEGTITIEGDEYTKHEPSSGNNSVFYNGGVSSNTALGDAVLIYNGEFR